MNNQRHDTHLVGPLQTEYRDPFFQGAFRDLRYSLRMLRRSPGFALVSTVTMALGIGAATAVFCLVNGVLINPLPYRASHELVSVWNSARGPNNSGPIPLSATQFFTYREENRTFAAFGLWSTGTASVTVMAEPEEVPVLRVTYGTLQALGVAPTIGRWFSLEDDTPGSAEAVLLANAYWKRRYGGDPSVIGRTIIIDALPRTVIGVMPDGFRFLNVAADVIVPLRFDRNSLVLGAFNYSAVGRLVAGVTLEQANADVNRMNQIWLNAWPSPPGFDKERFDRAAVVRPLKQELVGNIGDVLWVLLGMAGVVLVISCANVTNLLLVRAEQRRQELAVRIALGAGVAPNRARATA